MTTKIIDIKIGLIIRYLRNKKGYSLRDISNLTGLSKSSLSNIENSINNPTIKNLNKICNALGINSDYLDRFKYYFDGLYNKHKNTVADKTVEEVLDYVYEQVNKDFNQSENSFNNAEEAIKFILSQPVIMGYGGFDIRTIPEKDIIEFANDLLKQIKYFGYLQREEKK